MCFSDFLEIKFILSEVGSSGAAMCYDNAFLEESAKICKDVG